MRGINFREFLQNIFRGQTLANLPVIREHRETFSPRKFLALKYDANSLDMGRHPWNQKAHSVISSSLKVWICFRVLASR